MDVCTTLHTRLNVKVNEFWQHFETLYIKQEGQRGASFFKEKKVYIFINYTYTYVPTVSLNVVFGLLEISGPSAAQKAHLTLFYHLDYS